jgi:hypothetical protein
MKRFTLILIAVLAVQLTLALALTFTGSNYAAFKADEPLLAFDKSKIDEIAIDESGGKSVTLKKAAGEWIVPGLSGFPAAEAPVTSLLTKLAELKKGWPVATTSDAAERFKVTDKKHERRIVLSSGGEKQAELLLGESPAFKQIYARAADDNAIYNVAMATYEAGAAGEDWMQRNFLSIPIDKTASIAMGDIVIEKGKDGKFAVAGLSADQQSKKSEVDRLIGAVIHARFDSVEGKGKEALAKLGAPDIQITVKRTEGAPVIYKYKKDAKGDDYLFASSEHDYLFRVSKTNADPIVTAKRDKLIEPKKQEEAKTDEAKGEAAKTGEAKTDETKTDAPAKEEVKKEEPAPTPHVEQTSGRGG